MAYFTAVRWKFLLVWPAALLAALLVWALWAEIGALVLVAVYTALAYLIALGVGSGACRAVSLVVYWIVAQIAPWAVSILFVLAGYSFSVPLPALWEYPLYVAVYATIAWAHIGAVNWCQRAGERPPVEVWLAAWRPRRREAGVDSK